MFKSDIPKQAPSNPEHVRHAKSSAPKQYDLEDRTLAFAKRVLALVSRLPKSIANIEVTKQLVRAAGSIGANYIEANESLGKKDFVMHLRISRKEAKEARYWLQLVEATEGIQDERSSLIQESTELMKIFGAIIQKST